MPKGFMVTIVLATVVLAGFFVLSWRPNETVYAQDATIETAQIERRTLGQSVETTGTIASEETIYLTFNTSGAVNGNLRWWECEHGTCLLTIEGHDWVNTI